jgi:FkbM family methyltransferase
MDRVRKKNASEYTLPYAPHWGEWFPGYSNDDLEVFSCFPPFDAQPEPGFVTNFVGVRTRTADLWEGAKVWDGKVLPVPVPNDVFEGAEWVAVLKSMISLKGSCRVTEIGAGWGPWVVTCGTIADWLGIQNIRLYGFEADPGRFELMRRHFKDNNISAERSTLFTQAVGPANGRAKWPKIYDVPNSGGARPVRLDETNNKSDVDYMGRQEWIDVDIVSFTDTLLKEPEWDLIHIDVQGWEHQICASAIDEMNARVGWVVIGTHSRKIDGDLIDLFNKNGWILENEKPAMFKFTPDTASLEKMTFTDGVQGWRNPRIKSDWRSYLTI